MPDTVLRASYTKMNKSLLPYSNNSGWWRRQRSKTSVKIQCDNSFKGSALETQRRSREGRYYKGKPHKGVEY